jgi:chemotaxis protein MotA
MAESTSTAAPAAKESSKAAGKPSTAAKPKASSSKLDLATLGGIALALLGIVGGLLLEKGSIQDIAQGTAALIVLGGTFGAVLVTNPLSVVIRAFAGAKNIVVERVVPPESIIELLIQYATKARKNGIVSLESEAAYVDDPFLRKALGMAVDGTDLQEIKKMMEIDINLTEQAAESEAKVWEAAGGYAPTIGIIGAVLGLIQVMKHLEDIKEVGHGIAVAFVATVYGVGSASILFLPAANKLRARMRQVTLLRDMTMEGVIGIVEGLNPTLIRMKLQSFIQESDKPAKSKARASAAPPAAKAGKAPQASAAGS